MTTPRWERERRQLRALLYGVSDMASVAATAKYLNDAGAFGLDGNVRRATEAGLIVVYSRPFIGSRGLPRLSPASGLGEHARSIHDQILLERRTSYAHSDEKAYRMVIELEQPDWLERFVELGSDGFSETWKEPGPDFTDAIRSLARANRASFFLRIERLRQHLASKGSRSH